MNRFACLVLACGLSGTALATLPPVDDATRARNAESSARSEWQRKVDGYLLCKAQDRIAARVRATQVPIATPPCVYPPPFAYNAPAEKPLESSGAHSPTGTAASPPSVRQPSAMLAPAPGR